MTTKDTEWWSLMLQSLQILDSFADRLRNKKGYISHFNLLYSALMAPVIKKLVFWEVATENIFNVVTQPVN